jgi:2-phospho-L-lactate/phosphoenolpyruvate guanylyltransferase
MDRNLWAVVPVKDLQHAKQRLAGVLDAAERRALFAAMLEDVLGALAASAGLAGILVVTRDPLARELASCYGARVLVEPENRGHSAASSLGAATLAQEGTVGMLQLPADLPLLTAEDIDAVLQAHAAAPAITLAPSRDRRGSNAVACSPPDLLPLRFGEDSFRSHLERARGLGVEPRIVERPGLALDVDTPADLLAFLAAPSATRAYAYLARNGIAERLCRDCGAARSARARAARSWGVAYGPMVTTGRSSSRPTSREVIPTLITYSFDPPTGMVPSVQVGTPLLSSAQPSVLSSVTPSGRVSVITTLTASLAPELRTVTR